MKDETGFRPLGEPHLLKAGFDSAAELSRHGRPACLPAWCGTVLNKTVTFDYLPSISTPALAGCHGIVYIYQQAVV